MDEQNSNIQVRLTYSREQNPQHYASHFHDSVLRISRFSSKLTAAQVRAAFRQAWKLWAQAVPLKFHRQRRSDADIIISFNNKGVGRKADL